MTDRKPSPPARIRTLAGDTAGATAVEYGLLAAIVAIGLIGVLSTLGGSMESNFEEVGASLTTETATAPVAAPDRPAAPPSPASPDEPIGDTDPPAEPGEATRNDPGAPPATDQTETPRDQDPAPDSAEVPAPASPTVGTVTSGGQLVPTDPTTAEVKPAEVADADELEDEDDKDKKDKKDKKSRTDKRGE